jgi:hypothetical protein
MMTRAIRATVIPLVCLAMLTIGSGRGQPQVKTDDPPVISKIPDLLGPPRAPAAQSVDELIAKLELLRKQKAELEKQELTVVAQLKALVKLQSERLSKLGVIAGPPVSPSATIIGEGILTDTKISGVIVTPAPTKEVPQPK